MRCSVVVELANMMAIGCMEKVVGAVAKTMALELRAAGGAMVSTVTDGAPPGTLSAVLAAFLLGTL